MIDLTNLPAESLHHSCKHSTVSATTFTALRNVNTTTRTDNLSDCLLVVDSDSIPDRSARSQSLYRLSYPAHDRYILPLTTTAYDLKLGITDLCDKSDDDLKNGVAGGWVPV